MGIRRRDFEKDKGIPRLSFKMASPLFECHDPFVRNPITSYSELTETFEVSDRRNRPYETVEVTLTKKNEVVEVPKPQSEVTGSDPVSSFVEGPSLGLEPMSDKE